MKYMFKSNELIRRIMTVRNDVNSRIKGEEILELYNCRFMSVYVK